MQIVKFLGVKNTLKKWPRFLKINCLLSLVSLVLFWIFLFRELRYCPHCPILLLILLLVFVLIIYIGLYPIPDIEISWDYPIPYSESLACIAYEFYGFKSFFPVLEKKYFIALANFIVDKKAWYSRNQERLKEALMVVYGTSYKRSLLWYPEILISIISLYLCGSDYLFLISFILSLASFAWKIYEVQNKSFELANFLFLIEENKTTSIVYFNSKLKKLIRTYKEGRLSKDIISTIKQTLPF